MSTLAEVRLWGRTIGAVRLREGDPTATFQYDPDFARSGIEVSPLTMPLSRAPYRFPALAATSFRGLPGLLADSLPDRFGRALIDAWLARRGRAPDSLDAVEMLCYVGARGMGALEYRPATGPDPKVSSPVDVARLVALASQVLEERRGLRVSFAEGEEEDSLRDILRVGTSAGGARAKAVLAWNPSTGEVRSGQVDVEAGFEPWLLKFDGVSENRDKELADPRGHGAVEYAYSRMARAAGLTMNPCRLLEEGGRRHFMTRRFDRTAEGDKLHLQSLGALAHLDLDQADAHSYEQYLDAVRRLGLGMEALEQAYRRMVFNVLARNQDDHVKNLAFLMDRRGRWWLAPAFDVTYAHNPEGAWTHQHQLSVNGVRRGIVRADLVAVATAAGLARGRGDAILEEVNAAVQEWPRFAEQARVEPPWIESIGRELASL